MKISVCLAAYNGEEYISSQVCSIIDQLGVEDELIVSDDGSSDRTVELVKAIDDPRIKVCLFGRDKTGMTPARLVTTNFENALIRASGDLIFLSDQDDVWLPDKVETMVKHLQNSAYVASDCYVIDADGNVLSDTRFTSTARIQTNRYLALFRPTPYQGSCVAFRREILEKALPIMPYIQSHDRWIGMIASFYYDVKFIPDKLILYRRHRGNVSTSSTGVSPHHLVQRIMWRVGYILGLFSVRRRGHGSRNY